MDENQLQNHYLDTFNNDLMQQLVPFETYKDMANDGGVSSILWGNVDPLGSFLIGLGYCSFGY